MQLDLMDFSDVYTTKSNYKYLLIGIDVFTRKVYIEPMKSKNIDSVIDAMNKILKIVKPKKNTM